MRTGFSCCLFLLYFGTISSISAQISSQVEAPPQKESGKSNWGHLASTPFEIELGKLISQYMEEHYIRCADTITTIRVGNMVVHVSGQQFRPQAGLTFQPQGNVTFRPHPLQGSDNSRDVEWKGDVVLFHYRYFREYSSYGLFPGWSDWKDEGLPGADNQMVTKSIFAEKVKGRWHTDVGPLPLPQLTDMDTMILDCAQIPKDERVKLFEDPPALQPRYSVLDFYLPCPTKEKPRR